MIVSLDITYELLTTIYYKIFSRNRKDVNKYDVLLFLDDFYYFDLLKGISKDIKELDNSFLEIDKKDFNIIFESVCTQRSYIALTKKYSSENEKRVELLYELLADLLCLLISNKSKKKREIEKVYFEEEDNWSQIENVLKKIANTRNMKINKINEDNMLEIIDVDTTQMKNNNFVIQKEINVNKKETLDLVIQKYNEEYKSRYYYMFLNYYLTMQTMFLSELINLYSEDVRNIIKEIIQVRNKQYKLLNIYDVLSFQFNQIQFNKSSSDNLKNPLKKIKMINDVVERGGIPFDYSDEAIIKNVRDAAFSLREKDKRGRQGSFHEKRKRESKNFYKFIRRN